MKYIFTLTLFFTVTFSATSQVTFGVKAGLNVNMASTKASGNLHTDASNYDIDNNIGAHLGGFVRISLSEKFHFKPGVTLARRGGGTEKERTTVHFTDVPVAFGYTPVKRFSVEVAPVLSYRVHATTYSYIKQDRINVTSSIEAFNFGASAGVGYALTDKWSVEASAYKSFNESWDISFRDMNNDPAGKVSYYLNSVSVGVSYLFVRK